MRAAVTSGQSEKASSKDTQRPGDESSCMPTVCVPCPFLSALWELTHLFYFLSK